MQSRTMPRNRLAARALAAALAAASGAAVAADVLPPVVERVCAGCHGLDGNYGWLQVPRLAAQNAGYIVQQVNAYRLADTPSRAEIPPWLAEPPPAPVGARADRDGIAFMVGTVKSIDEKELSAAAAWYASRKPLPGTAGDPALMAAGRTLFEKGDPAKGVPACLDCHGASGQGLGPFPRLAGQHAGYLERQMRAFDSGQRPHAGPMEGVAKKLTPEDIAAVAAYAQSL